MRERVHNPGRARPLRIALWIGLTIAFAATSALQASESLATTGDQARNADAPSEAAPAANLSGDWAGSIDLPTGELVIATSFEYSDGRWLGTIDIPAQGARRLGLREITIGGDRVHFEIVGVPGQPTFRGTIDGDEMAGQFTQSGAELFFELKRGASADFGRPQAPQPPFPYTSEAVEYTNGRIRLAGTLTLPEGAGPHPAVVLLSGSGPQDRNGTLFNHEPFLVLADQLGRRGIAVLRSDDRGVGGSSGTLQVATIEDLAADARAAVAYLANRPEVDSAAIGLLGHSEGGLVAPAALQHDETEREGSIRFVVLLGAPGVRGDLLLARQTELLLEANGVDSTEATAQVGLLRNALDLVLSNAPEVERRSALRALAKRQLKSLPEAERRALGSSTESFIDQQITMALTPWFTYFVRYDPLNALSALEVPVLSIHGSLDLQVDPSQNAPAIRNALTDHGDATILVLDDLNHLLQTATTGSPLEYGVIEETIDPLVLETIFRWIAERFPPSKN